MIIYGNGSHSKIIMESLHQHDEKVVCFIDDNCFEQEFNTIQKNVKIGKNSHIASGTILIESVPEGYDNVLRKIN